VKLGEAGGCENYVAGQPFPKVDPTEKQAAVKMMWNFNFRPSFEDDLDLRNFDATPARSRKTGHCKSSVTSWSITSAGCATWGDSTSTPSQRSQRGKVRVQGDPAPPDRAIRPQRRRLHLLPLLRSGEAGRQLAVPAITSSCAPASTAQRSDALFGQDTDQDSYGGYAGQIAWAEWKYLGEKEVLGAMHTTNLPVKWVEGNNDFAFEGEWEKRKVYVVEGESKLPQYAYSKRVLYLDKENYDVPFTDMYDRAGQLWKIWINNFTQRKEAFSGAKITYDEETSMTPAIVMVDMQLQHATRPRCRATVSRVSLAGTGRRATRQAPPTPSSPSPS